VITDSTLNINYNFTPDCWIKLEIPGALCLLYFLSRNKPILQAHHWFLEKGQF